MIKYTIKNWILRKIEKWFDVVITKSINIPPILEKKYTPINVRASYKISNEELHTNALVLKGIHTHLLHSLVMEMDKSGLIVSTEIAHLDGIEKHLMAVVLKPKL